MISMFDRDPVQKALFYASEKHNGQYLGRPPKEVPYSTHFFGVALNALNFTMGEDLDRTFLLTLAILHDTLEDTSATYDELVTEFGERVAKGVLALSKDENLPGEIQMIDSVERIKHEPKEVAIVKMADRMFNIRKRFSGWTIEKQEAYKREAQMICDQLGYASPTLANALQTAIDVY